MKRSTINSIKLGPLYWTSEELELEKLSLEELDPKDDLELDELELDGLELDGLISLCPAVADELLGEDPSWIRVTSEFPLLPLLSPSATMAGRLSIREVMTSNTEYSILVRRFL